MTDLIHSLARTGAALRYAELADEARSILDAFPDLVVPAWPEPSTRPASPAQAIRAGSRGKTRPTMTPAQKAAVSARMKVYWAKRRKAEGRT